MGDSSPGSSRRARAAGFQSEERQDTRLAAPLPPELRRALAAASRGDWRPAAALMATTRENEDWELRSQYANALGEAAADDDGWLSDWQAAAPDDPDAALVRPHATVTLAWRLRGGGWAKDTGREQFAGFHRVLPRSLEEVARAAELNPGDPTPYVPELWAALGLGYPHARMDRLWDEITDRDPHHCAAHTGALQYWCAKWRGSEELAVAFARRAAAGAPPGSLLTALPLIAWWEHHKDARPADFRSPAVVTLVDAALADAAAARPDHPRLPELRHLLAFFLTKQRRYEAAVEQFRLVDGYVDALPWRYYEHPAAAYCSVREKAVRGAGPFWKI
ncbi:DUF4034 domain-containing protein [Streptomyces sp. GC420]|nr:DUF4034 domain-containing protein [Streptomyces sp. GC420]NBM20571.1 DUF4034 domain-containing protein [Streptomyces sp. GC420]